jgi:hypothetical protein
MPAPTNHAQDASILDMTAVKLPTLIDKDDATTQDDLSLMTYELMVEFEKCFKVAYREIVSNVLTVLEQIPANATDSNIGNESFYKPIEKSILSDLLAMQWVFRKASELASSIGTNSTGTGTDAAPGTILKKAVAGSAEVEFDKLDIKNVPLLIDAPRLIGGFKASAIRKALTIGCVVDINDDLVFNAYLQNPDKFINPNFFMVRSGCQ